MTSEIYSVNPDYLKTFSTKLPSTSNPEVISQPWSQTTIHWSSWICPAEQLRRTLDKSFSIFRSETIARCTVLPPPVRGYQRFDGDSRRQFRELSRKLSPGTVRFLRTNGKGRPKIVENQWTFVPDTIQSFILEKGLVWDHARSR